MKIQNFSRILAGMMCLVASNSWATLPKSAISKMTLPVYGVYMTSDPLCSTGLVATVPLSKTSSTLDMTTSPTIGSGSIPAGGIKCVIIVMGTAFAATWSAGNYNSTSDSVCNGGGNTPAGTYVCRSSAVSFPQAIQADAAAIGLTLSSSTCASSGSASDVVPLYLSTSSACTGQHAADALVSGCLTGGNSNNNPWTPPTVTGDTLNGIQLTTPSISSSYTFVVDPTGAFGANGGTCQNTGPPIFSFHN